MEFTEVDKLLIDIFIATPLNEVRWNHIASYFSKLVEAADDVMIIEWPNDQIVKPVPYVQMRKDEYSIYLEAVGSFYVEGKFPPDAENSLLALGWQAPEFHNPDGRNWNLEFYGDDPDHKQIGELIMKTFRYGYACTMRTNIEISPLKLAEKVPYVALNQSKESESSLEIGVPMKKNGKKIFPSIVNREPLPKVSFETLAQRNSYVVEKRSEGYTLQSIADSLGLTREMIRQIVNAQAGPSADAVRKIRKEKQSAEVRELVKNMSNPDLDVLAERIDLGGNKVRKLLGSKAKKFPQGRRNFEQEYSNDELLSILKKYSALAGGPLSTKKFTELGGSPTIAIFLTRFGTWKKACDAAEVESGRVVRDNYQRAHTDDSMLAFIASYLADPRTNGSAAGYDKWQRNVDGAPSLALIRQRMGRWNDIKGRLLKEEF